MGEQIIITIKREKDYFVAGIKDLTVTVILKAKTIEELADKICKEVRDTIVTHYVLERAVDKSLRELKQND